MKKKIIEFFAQEIKLSSILIVMGLQLIVMLITLFYSIQSFSEAFEYRRAYENFQEFHESYRRTVGKQIDNAFICRNRK